MSDGNVPGDVVVSTGLIRAIESLYDGLALSDIPESGVKVVLNPDLWTRLINEAVAREWIKDESVIGGSCKVMGIRIERGVD